MEQHESPVTDSEAAGGPTPGGRHSNWRRRAALAATISLLVAGAGVLVYSQVTPSGTRTAQPSSSPSVPTAQGSAPVAIPSGPFDPLTFDYKSLGKSCSKDGVRAVATPKTPTVINDCTLDDKKGTAVTGPGAFSITNSSITSVKDGLTPTGTTFKTIAFNWIHRDGSRVGDNHQDGIQFWQGGNALIKGNRIEGWQTSAIMVKADRGPISHVTIDSNYLSNETGYYQLYVCPAAHGISYITVTNNVFAKKRFAVSTCDKDVTFVHTEAQRQAAIDAGNADAASWVVWNNNRFLDGSEVKPRGGWAE